MVTREITRRGFISGIASVAPTLGAHAEGSPSVKETKCLPIHDLDLPPEVLADLEQFAQPIITEARRLEELPLGDLPIDSMDPAAVFVPR